MYTSIEYYTGSNYRVGYYIAGRFFADYYYFGFDDGNGNSNESFANFWRFWFIVLC
jgi:hypothetical protein